MSLQKYLFLPYLSFLKLLGGRKGEQQLTTLFSLQHKNQCFATCRSAWHLRSNVSKNCIITKRTEENEVSYDHQKNVEAPKTWRIDPICGRQLDRYEQG